MRLEKSKDDNRHCFGCVNYGAGAKVPKEEVAVQSDQGSQYTSGEWRSYLKANNLTASMSRRGNCHENTVAESFFSLLKRERIRR